MARVSSRLLPGRLLFFAAALGAALAACHREHDGDGDGGGFDLSVPADLSINLVVSPPNPVIVVTPQNKVFVQPFTATVDGTPVTASWSTDRGELGTINGDGAYTTIGEIGGKGSIAATYNGQIATTTVTIQYKDVGEDGDPFDPTCTFDIALVGKGGYGGVGGFGPGCKTSPAQKNTLGGTPTADASLSWLYPYDATVFPRGQLAPLLMWAQGTHNVDAVRVKMASKSGTYLFDGTYATPHSAPKFVNLPIPQAVWETMNKSSSGDQVTVTISFAEGTTLYGPVTLKWVIAGGELRGKVYYNSYGTSLVTNSEDHDSNNQPFGAGVLGINPGKTDPVLIAGTNSSDMSGCRVCHTVTRDGSRLIVQRGNAYGTSRLVDLKNGNTESALSNANSSFGAMYPNGSYVFSSAGAPTAGDGKSQLYALPSGDRVMDTVNLPIDLQATTPSFAPDGSMLAFNWYNGASSSATADARSIATMTFDAGTKTFGDIKVLVTPQAGFPAVWPSFLPTVKGLVFEVETHSTSAGELANTRGGIRAHLEWVDLATKTAHTLDKLNGIGYLPSSPDHVTDTELNYEPTVNPVPSGGYAWVVFTSRRLYGNVATINPFFSDPRDGSFNWKTQITPKKLWVAAIDLNAQPGQDPSHPAFYLPAQELNAGNSRGFWTVDPCATDGNGCETGDQCCGGYCTNVEVTDGGVVGSCSASRPGCAMLYDKCVQDSDCCQPMSSIDNSGQVAPTCINGYCSEPNPPVIR